MTVEVLTGPPGSGKSTQMMQDMANQPGRYLWASPIIDLIDEQVPRMQAMAPKAEVAAIHGKSALRGGVSRNIDDFLAHHGSNAHVVAFVTHEGLLTTEPALLAGWHVRIDETPNAVNSDVMNIAQSSDLLQAHYDLLAIDGSKWSQVSPRTSDVNWKDFKQDDFGGKLSDFHALASKPHGVLVNLRDWNDARYVGRVEWLSVWNPAKLSACASVMLTGAGYFNSLTHRVAQACHGGGVQYVPTPARGGIRTGQPAVVIHYFTDSHRGTTTFWGTSDGRSCLVGVCDWLEKNAPSLGYWSGNDVVQNLLEHRVKGKLVKPKLAGLNSLRDHRSCAFIYSSKPVSGDEPLKSAFGLTNDDIIAAREEEDILQFAYRGAIRNACYDGPYDVYLYHRDQAEALAAGMRSHGLSNVTVGEIPNSPIRGVTVERRPHAAAFDPVVKRDRQREQNRIRSKNYRDRNRKR